MRNDETLQAGGQPQPPAERAPEKYLWPKQFSVIGTPVKRLDGPDKVAGRARYTFDISRPGMLYGRIVRSPHPHARVVSVDLTAAQASPGCKVAIRWKDPGTKVMYQGDPVAAVAADIGQERIKGAGRHPAAHLRSDAVLRSVCFGRSCPGGIWR